MRVNGELTEMPVDNALEFAALGLDQIRKYSGADAIGVICGGMLSNEEYYAAQKFARLGIGTNNIDNVAGPWQQAAHFGLKSGFGDEPAGNLLAGIAEAKSILVLGSNTIEMQAIAALRARKAAREGAVMIVAHYDPVPLKKTAKLYLPLQKGSEDALVKGFIKTFMEEERAHKAGAGKLFKKISGSIKSTPWQEISEKTGLSENAIREAAGLYAGNKPAILIYGMDPAASPVNEEFYYSCCLLQQYLNPDVPARETLFVLGSAGNGLGGAEFGALPGFLPGFHAVSSAAERKMAAKAWGVEPPAKPGMSWPEMFSAIERGDMKGLYLIGVDAAELGIPAEKLSQILEKLEFLVVEDCVLSPASDHAHLVLPATSFVEKEGTAINCERRMQRLRNILPSPGEARSDFDLIRGLAAHFNLQLTADHDSILKEAAQFIPVLEGIELEGISKEGILLDGKKS